MGSKGGGGSSTAQAPNIMMPQAQMAREQSPEELRLLKMQGDALSQGMAVAEEQNNRSRQTHDIWRETYLPVETGMIHGDANEANGYMDSESIGYASNPTNYMSQAKGATPIGESYSPKSEE